LKAKEADRSILAPLLEDLDRAGVDLDQDVVRDAFDLANEAHRTQRRRSGEPYVTHPIAAAQILALVLIR
jgi:GTP pyrophosphokinase